MDAMSDADVSAALVRVGLPADSPVRRLAGLTNLNYLVDTPDGRVVLRIPGEGTSVYIDRRSEEIAARATAAVGVNAEVLHFDATDGLMVTRFVEGATTMTPDGFRDLGSVARAGEVLRRLHTTSDRFAVDFQLFPQLATFNTILAEKGTRLPDEWAEVEALAQRTEDVLLASPRATVPSHCDPLCENFLDTGTRMYLIDYEYGGNNDPMWDLGDLSVEGSFGPEQDALLLRSYFGHEPTAHDVGRMTAYKALCDVLWSLWGWVQFAKGNPVDDFWAYGLARFRRCADLMVTAAYQEHLAAISAPGSES